MILNEKLLMLNCVLFKGCATLNFALHVSFLTTYKIKLEVNLYLLVWLCFSTLCFFIIILKIIKSELNFGHSASLSIQKNFQF